MNFVQPIRDLNKIEQLKQVLKHQSDRNYFLFVLGINLGFRISDLLRLKVMDIKNREYVVMNEKKNGKPIHLRINPSLRKEINKYVLGKKYNQYLFPSRTGKGIKPISRVMAYLILSSAGRKVGLGEIGTHTLRKTFAYHFYKKYKDVALLQKILNHRNQQETLLYIGIVQDIQDEAMNDFSL